MSERIARFPLFLCRHLQPDARRAAHGGYHREAGSKRAILYREVTPRLLEA
jgi:hypothetical protein